MDRLNSDMLNLRENLGSREKPQYLVDIERESE